MELSIEGRGGSGLLSWNEFQTVEWSCWEEEQQDTGEGRELKKHGMGKMAGLLLSSQLAVWVLAKEHRHKRGRWNLPEVPIGVRMSYFHIYLSKELKLQKARHRGRWIPEYP